MRFSTPKAIAIPAGKVVGSVNRLENGNAQRQARADDRFPNRLGFSIFDQPGYLPFNHASGQLPFHLIGRLYECTYRQVEGSGLVVFDQGPNSPARNGLFLKHHWFTT
ncbi:hypothetical protein [Pseudorhizobium flavum]|uniref:Uncharacterized protein n=1 Tax=Pseudorhizobium flavum TaxID=1335061 RepID=A0A7W9YTG2_9HYPH|nr:hypothetical protein [Pseudorhizobium flavum]MBB6178077.1 hypothetical protein [Pseudorhizobium flavum]CAD6615044.1 transposase [Pseudorhizobium flavum]